MRKLSVVPIGTPDERKPTKTGTALHEQNGVTTPADAAIKLPTPGRLPPKKARVLSIVMYERRIVTTKVIPTSSRIILVESKKKNLVDSPTFESLLSGKTRNKSQFQNLSFDQ